MISIFNGLIDDDQLGSVIHSRVEYAIECTEKIMVLLKWLPLFIDSMGVTAMFDCNLHALTNYFIQKPAIISIIDSFFIDSNCVYLYCKNEDASTCIVCCLANCQIGCMFEMLSVLSVLDLLVIYRLNITAVF